MVDQVEIHRKVVSDDVEERREAMRLLSNNFADLPNKKEACEDLIRLTRDEDFSVRWRAADVFSSALQYVLNKDGAWKDLIRLTRDKESLVRLRAANALGSTFQYVPDKDDAWDDLHRLTRNEDSSVRLRAAVALGSAFQYVSDKDGAWEDLIRLTRDEYFSVRSGAAVALGSAFQYVSDKDGAWEDLHRLTRNKDSSVRSGAAVALGSALQYAPDKDGAWEDLIRLTRDEYFSVRSDAAVALGSAFQYVSDKDRAWEDLIRMTRDEDFSVRSGAAFALGSAFQYVSNKDGAWEDLIRLTHDENSNVRASANHSLGSVSIFRATEAESENDFESELKNAIEFFERSSKEKTYSNPSRFCLPFYRSFYTVTFEKKGAKDEVQSYLTEAKSASEGSENKGTLLKAVENLANALSEAHNVTDFDTKKSELNSYRRYCDRASDLIGDASEGAPGAARVLRRGLPIIDDRIKEIIRKVQEKARAVCRETRGTGTPYEPLGIKVNKLAGELSDRDYLQNERSVSRIIDILEEFCDLLPEDKKKYPCKIVEEIHEESELEDKLIDIATAFSYMKPCIESQLQKKAKPMTDKTRSDEQPLQKTSHNTTVYTGAGSNVTVTQTEKESGDVTVNTAITKESQPDKQPDRTSKRTVIEISADIAVHVLVYTVLHHFAEDLMPVIAPILVLTAVIILLLIIRNAKSG